MRRVPITVPGGQKADHQGNCLTEVCLEPAQSRSLSLPDSELGSIAQGSLEMRLPHQYLPGS